MVITRIEIRFTSGAGSASAIEIAPGPAPTGALSGARDSVTLSAHLEHALGGTIVRTTIANLRSAPIRLSCALFHVATGLGSDAVARFFKHGYQSWSGSGAVNVGPPRPHPRDSASYIARLNHQSEATRSPEFPEVQTSELFTIIESPSRAERLMIGFISAASALTTVTVPSPDIAVARVILDDVALAAGAFRELEPLFIVEADEPAARLAARWAAALGHRMDARVSAPYQRGWCSWYHYFHSITEDALRANIKALASMRAEFPLDLIQLDDGFQSALGDWDTTNAKFPSGLKKVADEIRAAGFHAGIWTAPFIAARDSRLMSEHPDWFIMHEQTGEPIRAMYNPNWTSSPGAFAYALDCSNDKVRHHLERLFARLTREFGYSYLKLDFLYAAAAGGLRHDPYLTRGETLRRGLEAIRNGAGESAFILGCGCPIGQAVGIVDGMRIGPDVSPFWGSSATGAGDPSTVYALDAIVARSFMHRRLWLNDPDCLMLRARETQLSADERAAMAATIAASGGMLLISDDMALLDSEAGKLFRAAANLSEQIDSASAREPVLALDLMATGDVRGLVTEIPGGAILMLLNRGDERALINTSDLKLNPARALALDTAGAVPPRAVPLDTARAVVIDLAGDESAVSDTIASDTIDLPPHSARIIRMTH
jgi:alpha-galactosidase